MFAAACEAFTEIVTEGERIAAAEAQTIEVRAATIEMLLVDLLSELVYRFEVDQWLTRTAVVTISDGNEGVHARVDLRGERFDPARHPIKVLVKAVTYHKLSVRQTWAGWSATVVFDI